MSTPKINFRISVGENRHFPFSDTYTTSDVAIAAIKELRKTRGMTAKHWQTVRLAVVKVTTTTQEIYVDTPTQQTEEATPPPTGSKIVWDDKTQKHIVQQKLVNIPPLPEKYVDFKDGEIVGVGFTKDRGQICFINNGEEMTGDFFRIEADFAKRISENMQHKLMTEFLAAFPELQGVPEKEITQAMQENSIHIIQFFPIHGNPRYCFMKDGKVIKQFEKDLSAYFPKTTPPPGQF